MPRLIKQVSISGNSTTSWVKHTFKDIPPKCKLTTLRFVSNAPNNRVSQIELDLCEDNDATYSLTGLMSFTQGDCKAWDDTVMGCVINLNHDYVLTDKAETDGSLNLYVKQTGTATAMPFKAYLIYSET
ncbi:MAG: hypothetical protein Unbinned2514contig1000_17 [Prokaryotic dsDNA virus sp.]|nr:MAG: hypothetical protein Unbinned2514contig1000_17 [Prokaryotic dsDNA virus sp.]